MLFRGRYGLLTFAVFVVVSWAWLSGHLPWWIAIPAWGACVLGGVAVQKYKRGPVQEAELGPVMYSAAVWVRVRPARFNTAGYGYVRLLVGEGAVATRARFVPRFWGKVNGVDYTLRAADFEVGNAPVRLASRGLSLVTWSFSVGPAKGVWDRAVVLKGPYGRRTLELEFFRSDRASRGEVQRELIRAGARPVHQRVSAA